MKRAIRRLSLIALTLSLSAPAAARPVRVGRYVEIPYGVSEAHPYPTAGVDTGRTGRSRATAPTAEPSLVWEARLRGTGRPSAPAIDEDGMLYVAHAAGVSAIDGSTGAVRWTVRLGYVTSTPSLTPTGEIVVGTRNPQAPVVVLSPDGEQRAAVGVGGTVSGSPLVLADGSIVLALSGRGSNVAYRLDADLRRIFRTDLSYPPEEAVRSPQNLLYYAARERLFILGLSGDVRASVPLGAPVVAGPAIGDDSMAWVLTLDGVLYQIAPNGAVRTRTELDQAVTRATEIALGRDGAVRIPTSEDALICVGPGGAERWRVEGEGGFLGGVTLDAADTALVLNDQGVLEAISAAGQVLWRVRTGTRSDSVPVLGADGTVYVATQRGTIQAYR